MPIERKSRYNISYVGSLENSSDYTKNNLRVPTLASIYKILMKIRDTVETAFEFLRPRLFLSLVRIVILNFISHMISETFLKLGIFVIFTAMWMIRLCIPDSYCRALADGPVDFEPAQWTTM